VSPIVRSNGPNGEIDMSMMNERDDAMKGSSDFSWKVIGGVGVLVLALIFIVQNTNDAEITFLFWDFTVGLWFGLLIAMLLGMVIGWLLPKFLRRKRGDD
jgi:uncharacterized integral membrane protein